MNKREINEIKALFKSADDNHIERIAGCYVDLEKNIVSTFNKAFLNIEREEIFKYLEIFSKTMSGTQGKNLLDMSFVLGNDGNRLLESMRKAELKDDNLNKLFFDKIIETYEFAGSYIILLVYQAYDVPGITGDGIKMTDASEEVFSYILCSLCPVGVTKPGLGYVEELNEFHNLKQDKVVKMPENGFLYPAFNDRSTDTSGLLYYTQKGDRAETAMLSDFLGVRSQIPPAEQKEIFQNIVMEAVAEEADMEVVAAIQENLVDMVSVKKKQGNTGTPVVIDKEDVSAVLKKSGLKEEKVKEFEEKFEAEFSSEEGGKQLYAANVLPASKKLEVKTPDVVVKINYDKTSLVETRVIDGKKCLVIELGEGLVVNGIPIQSGKQTDISIENNEADSDSEMTNISLPEEDILDRVPELGE